MHGDEDNPQLSTAPLLSAGSSDMDEPKGGRVRATVAVSKLPIVFISVTAGFLFFLMVVTYWHPGTLEWYLRVPVPSFEQVPVSTGINGDLNSSLIISYENTPVLRSVLMTTSLNATRWPSMTFRLTIQYIMRGFVQKQLDIQGFL